MKKIVFVAGDKSGDLYAGDLSRKLKDLYGDTLEIYSFGGDSLKTHSTQLINLVEHSVSGIAEVLRHFKDILNVFCEVTEEIKRIKPDLVVLVDFPDFNLRLAKKLHGHFRLFYYISPQVWAWRKNRIYQIKRYLEKIIVLFKFEEELYRHIGMDVACFGHPLLETIPQSFQAPASRGKRQMILFLPGSRRNEIRKHLPVMLAAKEIIAKSLPHYTFKIVRPKNIPVDFYSEICPVSVEIIEHSYAQLAQAEFILASSGTATLEIAILGIPFLIMYKVNWLTWLILKNIVHIHFIGMPNIIARKEVAREFIQNQATPQRIARHTIDTICHPQKLSRAEEGLKTITERLKPKDAITQTAHYLGKSLGLEPANSLES